MLNAWLWQVLEGLSFHAGFLDIINSMHAQDSGAECRPVYDLQKPHAPSANFRESNKDVCSARIVACMNGVEKHLWETADIGVPDLRGILAPLPLYADDLILMSASSEELQQQLDALVSLREQCHLAVNLSKSKVVVFVAQRIQRCQYHLFFFDGIVEELECHKECRYLGLAFCAICLRVLTA